MQWVWGPYDWDSTENAWKLPPGCFSSLDYRRPVDRGPQTLGMRNFAIFAADNDATFGVDHVVIGTGNPFNIDIGLGGRERVRDDLLLPSTPNAANLGQLMAELYMKYGDPDGVDMAKPMVPTSKRVWKLSVAGHSVEIPFNRLHVAYPRLKLLLRSIYRKLRQEAIDGHIPPEHYRKWLGYQCRKYFGRFNSLDYREFIPNDLPDELPLRPETSVSDNFNRSNEALSVGNWTEVLQDWDVVSNQARATSASSGKAIARYDTDLSGDDIIVEVDFVASSPARYAGPTARNNSSNSNCYLGKAEEFAILSYMNSGSETQLSFSDTLTATRPYPVRLEVDGSSLELYVDDVLETSTTDTTHSGQLRGGMFGHILGSTETIDLDNWSAQDIATEQTIPTGLSSSTESALTLTRKKSVTVTVPSEIDSVLGVSSVKTVKISRKVGARQLTDASSQSFTRSDHATFDVGSDDFWVHAKVYLDTVGVQQAIFGRSTSGTAATISWIVDVLAANTARLLCSNGSSFIAAVTSVDSLSQSQWHDVFVWRSGSTVYSRVDRGSIGSSGITGDPQSGSLAVNCGAFNAVGTQANIDGRLCRIGFGRVAAGTLGDGTNGTLADTISRRLDNDGLGLIYGEITSAERTAWGLTSGNGVYHNGNELNVGDDLIDSVGGLDLAATNSPGVALGPTGESESPALENSSSLALTTPKKTVRISRKVGARQLTAGDTEYFTRASEATFEAGNVDHWCAAWVYLDSSTLGISRGVIGKNAGGAFEYLLYSANTEARFLIGDGSSSLDVIATGALSTGQWHFLFGWYDATSGTIGIQVNNGTPATKTSGVTPGSATGPFRVGDSGFSEFWDGRIARAAFGKPGSSLGDGTAGSLSATISERLYNDGTGLIFGEITSAERTAWGLTSGNGTYYNGNELNVGDDIIDGVAGLNLSAVNSPGVALGPTGESETPSLERNSAFPLTGILKGISVSFANETDSSQPVTSAKDISVGLPQELNSALDTNAASIVSAGLAQTTEQAFTISPDKTSQVALVTTTEQAFTVDSSKSVMLGLPTETDQVFDITFVGATQVGIASSTEQALAVISLKEYALGLPFSIETSQPVASARGYSIGLALETDSVFSASFSRTYSVGLTTELSTPQSVSPTTALSVATTEETDSALSVLALPHITTIQETNSAFSVSSLHTITISQVEETNTALTITKAKSYTLGIAEETDSALAATVITTISPGMVEYIAHSTRPEYIAASVKPEYVAASVKPQYIVKVEK